MLEITPISTSLKVGDIITMDVVIDRRNWWQRHAPMWLGGQAQPTLKRQTFTVTHQTTGVWE